MFNPTAGPAREKLSARKRFDEQELEEGRLAARERLTRQEFDDLQRTGTVIIDDRRRRPLYFDGRFLAAHDLTREQNYFLTRQADLGRAGGSGVVTGLFVEMGNTDKHIRISAGHGVTSSGELVMLPNSLTINLADVAESQRLDAAFGLMRIPRESARNRTGLFVVALRPVEFSANPIASYPTSVTGTRSTEDGEIIEAVIVTLVPYPDQGAGDTLDMRRARVAREIFVDRGVKGIPVGALPLAMIATERGAVRWVDPFMVRREVGAEHGDVLGLGFAPRALREAHLLQYQNHLDEVLEQRKNGNRGQSFSASEHFQSLPPAASMPTAAIDTNDFTQRFFPAEIDVDLSFIPSDEVAAALEESLLLPPIDLTLDGEELESVSVLVLIPVERHRVRALKAELTSTEVAANPLTRPLKTAAPGLVAKRRPLESLIRLPRLPVQLPTPERIIDDVWRRELQDKPTLFYVRRRNVNYRAEVVGLNIRAVSDDVRRDAIVDERIKNIGLSRKFTSIKKRASTEAVAEMTALLGSPKVANSRLLLSGVVNELENARARAEGPPVEPGRERPGEDEEPEGGARIDRLAVLKVGERFAHPKFGEGITLLENESAEIKEDAVVKTLVQSGTIPELDEVGRRLDEAQRKAFVKEVVEQARQGGAEKVREVISQKVREIRR
ncbi:MAG TPA: hypothetical protein VNI02_21830 [Blastocatellia bacterium]|nr:hypothetical protein [Blastocatellia bacterium]